jgi:hypothetical protein
MTVKIWRVEFGDNFTSVDVDAANFKEAARKAQIYRKKDGNTYLNRTQDIQQIRLIAETD